MNRISLVISMSFLVSCISCTSTNNKDEKKETTIVAETPQKVPFEVLRRSGFPFQLISNGILKSSKSATLFFETSGTLKQVYFKNGDIVKKGEIIAAIENTKQSLDLQKAEESLNEAKVDLSSLLLGFGGKPDDTTSVASSLLQSLKSQSGYTMAVLNLRAAKMEYQNTILKAPFSGLIAGIEKQNFNQINASEQFCILLDTHNFTAYFSVIEQELTNIKKGQKVKILPVAFDSVYFEGTISEINPLIDNNGLIKVKAVVDKQHPNQLLFDGLNIKILIEQVKPDQLIIPKSALVLRSGKQVVFTYSHGLAKWNYVTTGGENGMSYLITDGLNEGDTVITDGSLTFAHDAAVELKTIP